MSCDVALLNLPPFFRLALAAGTAVGGWTALRFRSRASACMTQQAAVRQGQPKHCESQLIAHAKFPPANKQSLHLQAPTPG